uniref:Uncharacterized protein n=1 Tax=Bionectria ochroleuca TaxID=29856 RepID=A0A8H7NGU3_BIOOC
MLFTQLFALSVALLSPTAAGHDQPPYLTWMADTFIQDGVTPNYGYQVATLYLGFEKAYEISKDEKYLDWYKGQIDDHVVLENGTIKNWNYTRYVLDEYRIANNYLYLYDKTSLEKYKSAANIVRNMINSTPRSPSGGFWHQIFFRNQMWLDGLFMAQPFYAKWTHRYDADNQTAWNDILLQYDLIETHARNKTSGLIPHGWADGQATWADPVTGVSPHVWVRALGWYFMSLVEVLQVFPTSHPGYEKLMGYFVSLAEALKKTRDVDSGTWWQVMEDPYPTYEENFIEASGSAMFTYGWFKGIALGYLPKEAYLETAKDAYTSIVKNFISEAEDNRLVLHGTVDECNLIGKVDLAYYFSRPIRDNHKNGVGPFMLASFEWETWAKDA